MRRIEVFGFSLSLILCVVNLEAANAQCALPNTLTNGQTADATQVMGNFNALANCLYSAPAGSTNAVQFNGGSGSFGGVGPLTDGQLVIGSTGNAPQAATITAGSGIAVTNSAGGISISATGSSAQREFGPYSPPTAASFTFIDTPSSITPTVTDVSSVGLVYSVSITSNTSAFAGAYQAVPSAPWTLTIRAKYSAMPGSFPEFGLWIKDTSGKMLGAVLESRSGTPNLVVKRCDSNTSFNSNEYVNVTSGVPDWFRVTYDGTNIKFYVSWDSQNWLFMWSETSTAFLNGNLQYVGIGGLTGISDTAIWRSGSTTGAIITYWNIS